MSELVTPSDLENLPPEPLDWWTIYFKNSPNVAQGIVINYDDYDLNMAAYRAGHSFEIEMNNGAKVTIFPDSLLFILRRTKTLKESEDAMAEEAQRSAQRMLRLQGAGQRGLDRLKV